MWATKNQRGIDTWGWMGMGDAIHVSLLCKTWYLPHCVIYTFFRFRFNVADWPGDGNGDGDFEIDEEYTHAYKPVVCSSRKAPPLKGCAEDVESTAAGARSTWQESWDFCAAVGARLCYYDEVASGIGTRTGCDLDDRQIWTFTACDDGIDDGSPKYYVTHGQANKPKECKVATQENFYTQWWVTLFCAWCFELW